MVAIVVTDPSGIQEAREAHLLDPRAAVAASNVDLRRGSWRGVAMLGPVRRFDRPGWYYPVSRPDGVVDWLIFSDHVSLVESPVVADRWSRVYWTDEVGGGAYYAPRSEHGTTVWKLGVPAPSAPPVVTVTGGTGATIDRAYVYCWVTILDEVGPPSPPVVVEGRVDGTWTVSGLTWPTSPACAPINRLRIYRTVYSSNVSSFRLVAELYAPDTSIVDQLSDELLPYREQISSLYAGAPPSRLRGLVRHPAGFLAGYDERTIWLSEPWMPHAWPPTYTYTVPHNVRALGVLRDMLVVFTTGRVYVLLGQHPSAMRLEATDLVLTVPTVGGVTEWQGALVIAASTGLYVLTPSGGTSISHRVWLPSQWRRYWTPQTKTAADEERILVWFGPSTGCLFVRTGHDELAATMLDLPGVGSIVSTSAAPKIWFQRDDTIYEFLDDEPARLSWSWTSKLFRLAYPTNLGVVQVAYRRHDEPAVSGDVYEVWNAVRWNRPYLDVFDGVVLGGELRDAELDAIIAASTVGVPPLQVLGGVELWRLAPSGGAARLDSDDALRVRIWADGRLVFDQPMAPDVVRRLPSGYKAVDWQVQLAGGPRDEVWWVGLGTTIEDLKKV